MQLQLHAMFFFLSFETTKIIPVMVKTEKCFKLQGESQKWKGKGLAWLDTSQTVLWEKQQMLPHLQSSLAASGEASLMFPPGGLCASEELLYNIKIYRLQSIKELEWQIKKESKSGVLKSWSFAWNFSLRKVWVMNLNLWLLSDSHLQILQH